jgi:hypothetical protein
MRGEFDWKKSVLIVGVLGEWSIGVLEYWEDGVLGGWSVGIMEYWGNGMLEYWSVGREYWINDYL